MLRILTVLTAIGLFLASPSLAIGADDDLLDLQAIIDSHASGAVIELESGTYEGRIVIDKPLTLLGKGFPIIDGGGAGTIIEITAPDVTIDGMIIRSSGSSLDREDSGISVLAPRVTLTNNRLEDVLFGIFLRASPDSVVSGNDIGSKDVFIANRGDGIRLWESERSLVEENVIAGGRDTVFWFTDEIVVRNNEITGGRYGLHFMYSDGAVVEGNVLANNSVGAFMMYSADVTIADNVMAENHGPSGYGLGLKDMDRVTTTGNRFIGNRIGMYFDNSPYTYDELQLVSGNLFAYNQTGVVLQPSVKGNVFSGNAFVENAEQVGVPTSGLFAGNEWSHDGVGNYWSDFAGYDGNGDGIGDVPHEVDDLYDTLANKHPDLEFYQETPAAKAIAIAAEMFPILKPRALLEDEHPLISPPAMASVRGTSEPGVSLPLLAASIVMLIGAAATVIVPAQRRRFTKAEAST